MSAVVDAPPVGGAAHLRGHLVEGEVERGHLVGGARLGPDHGPLRERGQLEPYGAVALARVALVLDLDLHPDDPVVVLLEPGQLLLDVTAKPIRQLAVSTRDRQLPCEPPVAQLVSSVSPARALRGQAATRVRGPGTWTLPGEMESVRPTWSSTPQSPAEAFAASLPLLPFSRPPSHLTTGPRQDLPLSRTVIGGRPGGSERRPGSLTWTVSPATGIGLSTGRPVDRGVWTTQPRTRTDSMTDVSRSAGPDERRVRRFAVPAAPGPGGSRRRVAATAATAATASPTASSARCASRAVAPVVRTSSQTTSRARGRRRREPAQRRAGAVHRPGEVGGAGRGAEPGLVDDAGPRAQQRARDDVAPAGPQQPRPPAR